MTKEIKLKVLKDILKFSRRKLTKEELNDLIFSPLFLNYNFFISAALLVKRTAIDIEEFLALKNLSLEELKECLVPVDDDYDYFAKITPEEIIKAFIGMEEYLKNNPEQALENRRLNTERIAKIKENAKNNHMTRGA